MTVNYLGEDYDMREAENDLGKRTYTRRFKLETTTKAEGPYAVGSHGSLPKIGSVHNEDSAAWCNNIAVQVNKGLAWYVIARYSSERQLAIDPTTEPAIVTVTTEQFQKQTDLVNSAGDPYDPPYMMDDSRRVINVQKNMSGHPSWILDYSDTVNSDSFVVKGITYTAGQGKVQRVSIGEAQVRNGVSFVVVTIEIHLEKNGWQIRALDAGFREIDGYDRVNIVNGGDGLQPTAPVQLDGSGRSVADPTEATEVIRLHTVYSTAVFSALPLT